MLNYVRYSVKIYSISQQNKAGVAYRNARRHSIENPFKQIRVIQIEIWRMPLSKADDSET